MTLKKTKIRNPVHNITFLTRRKTGCGQSCGRTKSLIYQGKSIINYILTTRPLKNTIMYIKVYKIYIHVELTATFFVVIWAKVPKILIY